MQHMSVKFRLLEGRKFTGDTRAIFGSNQSNSARFLVGGWVPVVNLQGRKQQSYKWWTQTQW